MSLGIGEIIFIKKTSKNTKSNPLQFMLNVCFVFLFSVFHTVPKCVCILMGHICHGALTFDLVRNIFYLNISSIYNRYNESFAYCSDFTFCLKVIHLQLY